MLKMELPKQLELTPVETRLKYPIVSEKFDALRPGHAMVINNDDNDSRELYYRLIAERGPTFRWELLENGPKKWLIKITKSSVTNNEETIGKIISLDYRKSRALNSLDIDFSSDGNRTLAQVFEGKEQSMAGVLRQWEIIGGLPPEKEMNFAGWDRTFLTKYIIQLHHRFVNAQTRFTIDLAFKVAASNSSRNPEITEVAEIFAHIGKMLEIHGQEQEKVLFPYITALFDAHTKGTSLTAADFGHVSAPISLMQSESERVVTGLRLIRKLTNNYVAPAYSSSTCPVLYKLLAAYEEDTHLHLHLENNILFPAAIKTENNMRSKNQIRPHQYSTDKII